MKSLSYDGGKYIENLLPKYLGATSSKLNAWIMEHILLGMVKRFFEPGCKFDELMVLTGGQGAGKTSFIETVCLLTRKDVKNYFRFELDVSGLKKEKSRKSRPISKLGSMLKVSPLYIATVKEDFGLEKQFSYKESGIAAKKSPQCPKEKYDAIVSAFRYFRMIEE